MTEGAEPPEKNGSVALAKLLNQLNLPTLAAIALFGGGNFIANKNNSDEQRQDTLRAVREIHELHNALDEFEQRQKAMLEGNANLLRNQIQMLDNQSKMLEQLKQRHQSNDASFNMPINPVPLLPSRTER